MVTTTEGQGSEDEQSQSPFFRILPTEIRLQIYTHAMEEYELGLSCVSDPKTWPRWAINHDFRLQHGHDVHSDDDKLLQGLETLRGEALREVLNAVGNPNYSWVRPGYQGPKAIRTELLRTCRRVYSEARSLPMQTREVCLWFGDGPGAENQDSPLEFFRDGLTPYQRERVRSVHLFTKHFWLSDPLCFWHAIVATNLFQRVQHLRITIRKGDWEENDEVSQLVILPYWKGLLWWMAVAMQDAMRKTSEWNPEEHGEYSAPQIGEDGTERPGWMPPIDFASARNGRYGRGWGLAFGHMPNLEGLTMDFDVDESKRGEMERLAQWMARVWRFPLDPRIHGHHYLSAEDTPIERTTWHGGPNLCWSTCEEWDAPWCGGPRRVLREARNALDDPFGSLHDIERSHVPCADCKKMARRVFRGSGPRMYTWTIRWTGRRWNGPSFYNYFPDLKPQSWDAEGSWEDA